MCGYPNAFKGSRARQLVSVGHSSNFLYRHAQRVHSRIRVAPRIHQRLRVKSPNHFSDFLKFQHARAFWNQQANAQLNGRPIFHELLAIQDAQQIQIIIDAGPRRKRNERGMQGQPQSTKCGRNMQEISARVAFFQGREEYIVNGLHRRNHKQATGFLQCAQMSFVLSQVLDFYGHVVSHVGKFMVKFFDEWNGVAYTIKKVRIAERNMLRTRANLAAYILEYNFSWHDPENAVIYRYDRAVAAQMLASAACFRGPNNTVTIARNNEMSVFLQCGQS